MMEVRIERLFAAPMIITCPNCQTRYQLAEKAIGAAGRKVQCAQCRESWLAHAEHEAPAAKMPVPKLVSSNVQESNPLSWADELDDDRLFDEDSERALDAEFEKIDGAQDQSGSRGKASPSRKADADEAMDASEESVPATASDRATQKRRVEALARRQRAIVGKLPFARIRRTVRMVALVALMTLVGGGIYLRTELVRIFPDLGGIYAAVGLGVNVIGLEFSDVRTLRSLRDGVDVMLITALITNVSGRNANVPPVLVSILNEQDEPLYQWTAQPVARLMGPGDVVEFETQLNSAPRAAMRVKLIFASEKAGVPGTSGNQTNDKQAG